MKAETFEASLEKGSNRLYLKSDRVVAIRNGAFIKLGPNDIFYRVESGEELNVKKKFKCGGDSLTIKGNYEYKFGANDNCSITFKEYKAQSLDNIGKSIASYAPGQKIYCQGGIASGSSSNLSGESTEIEVERIGAEGEITAAKISRAGLYITPPENPVQVMDENGNLIEIDIDFEETDNVSLIERDFKNVKSDSQQTTIQLSYPLPKGIKEGEFMIFKQVILLDKPYANESFKNSMCQITFDYSPINNIPLLPPRSLNPQTAYNEGVKIIDTKLLELDKRLTRLENMNY
tara:strand:- start:2275 stop:3144 length:870 start_codon:yes stop_codon:yes gene_type:complete